MLRYRTIHLSRGTALLIVLKHWVESEYSSFRHAGSSISACLHVP